MQTNTLIDNLQAIYSALPKHVTLCAVSKFHSIESIETIYDAGHRIFGESRPQELKIKADVLPSDIEWHFIGHLQTNKVSIVVPIASLIESVDSCRLLDAISKEAIKIGRTVDVLLQVYVAQEQTKQGFSPDEVRDLLNREAPDRVRIVGLMALATLTDDMDQVRTEFEAVGALFKQFPSLTTLSMGMSGDYQLAIECGSTSVRIGTAIFSQRAY